MPVTIGRTPWVDDDGSGTTGTVINNAAKTSLYDEIDTALAGISVSDPGICQGRLTLTTAVPVTTADVVGATSIYFTPYKGNGVALYNGSAWVTLTFTEKTLALGTLTNDLPYDVFAYSNAGVVALELLAWTSKTARATALVLQDGVLCKTGALTRRYLGTFHTTSTTTTEDSAAKRLLWNYYHRVSRPLLRLETTDSWTYTTATWRQANGAAANQVAVVIGVAEVEIALDVSITGSNTTVGVSFSVAMGEDSTTSPVAGQVIGPASSTTGRVSAAARLTKRPAVGYHAYTWLEYSVATGVTTWEGDAGVVWMQNGLTGSMQG